MKSPAIMSNIDIIREIADIEEKKFGREISTRNFEGRMRDLNEVKSHGTGKEKREFRNRLIWRLSFRRETIYESI